MSERRFTADEANTMLGDLRPRLLRIRDARHTVIENGELVRERVAGDGGGTEGSMMFDALLTLRREVEHLAAEGILLRDPEAGLVDFPATVGDDDGFLCWRVDEDEVAYWHPPESGFRGRRPL